MENVKKKSQMSLRDVLVLAPLQEMVKLNKGSIFIITEQVT